MQETDPWVRKILWSRKWQPTPVSLPGESHGQRNLAGYSAWGLKEKDVTEHCCCCCCVASVVSNSAQPHRRQPTRLPRPWDSPGKNTGMGCHFLLQCRKVKSESEVAQLCPTLRDPMNCSLPGSSIHGIFQARVLEWGAIAFSQSICLLQSFSFSVLRGSNCISIFIT